MPQKSYALFIIVAASILLCCPAARSDDPPAQPPPSQDLTNLQIEDLMKIKVTSASRKEQSLSDIAAAVYVINQEEIKRSGAQNIPDLLRMVPGVQVAQIDANKWAITIRGFNGRYANKLLVLVDGRSVYTPLFAGVFWNQQDLMLEDLDRIEVIRGPGGSVWGANAVNGVINIITKHTKDTLGTLFSGGAGNEDVGFGNLRHGGSLGKEAYYRVYGKYFAKDASVTSSNARAPDQWEAARGGFRLDWDKARGGKVMVEGDIFRQLAGDRWTVPLLTPPYVTTLQGNYPQSGWNILGRWEQQPTHGGQLTAQTYFIHNLIDLVIVKEARNTFDFELQQQFNSMKGHSLIMGLGYRREEAGYTNTPYVQLVPTHKIDDLYSAFVHDEITLNKRLHLTLGSKFEHNAYTGFEIQPNIRLAWTPESKRTYWGAVSRAVRTPSRQDTGTLNSSAAFPGPGGITNLVTYAGNPNVKPETVLAFELGYRTELNDRMALDATAFYNVYDSIIVNQSSAAPFFAMTPAPPHVVIPWSAFNNEHAETYGFELSSSWQAAKSWKLALSYSAFNSRISAPAVNPLTVNTPEHQVSLRSLVNLSHNFEFDTSLFWVNRIADLAVPDYTRLDMRLGWKPKKDLEISIVGQNLLSQRHREFGFFQLQTPNQVERSVFGKATWRY